MLRKLLLTLALLFCATPAFAVCGSGVGNCYARAAGNWSTAATWSDTDGGGAATLPPTTGDNIFFTSNAGAGTYTIDATLSINNFDCTGSPVVTITHGAVTLTVTGTTFKFVTNVVYAPASASRIVLFAPADSATIAVTTAGKVFALFQISASGASKTGIVQLQDNLIATGTTSAGVTLTGGTFDTNGKTVLASLFSGSGAVTRKIMGNSAWTISGSSGWDTTTVTNLDTTIGLTSITLSLASGTSRSFNGGGLTFPNLTIPAGPPVNILGANTFTVLSITGPTAIIVLTGVTTTISTAPAWTTSAAAAVTVRSSTGVASTLAYPASSTVNWVVYENITCTGSPTSNNSVQTGTATNCGINAPGGGGKIIGG